MKLQHNRNTHFYLAITLTLLLGATAAAAADQVILGRDTTPPTDIKGTIDLTIVPEFDDARVTVTVDGQKIVEALRSPWHVPVDFGPIPVEHKIIVTATGPDRKRI